MINVLILAAGYAVRLQPLTLKTPKPLLKVGDKTILDRIIGKLESAKDLVRSVHIISNERFFENFMQWLKGCDVPFEVMVINDGTKTNETRLGAIRDMALAINEIGTAHDLLVVAGDNLFEFDLRDFLRFAHDKAQKVSVALHDIGDREAAKRYGVAEVDGKGKLVRFEEKPSEPRSTLISTGIYYFPKEKLSLINSYIQLGEKADQPGYYLSWLSKSDGVYGFVFDEEWFDIGDLTSLEEADKRYKQRSV